MILAEKIMTLRKKNGWSQEELAEQMKVSRQSVSKWESMQSVPDLDKVLLMAQVFGVSTDYLLKDDMTEEEYVSVPDEVIGNARRVSMEEASAFLTVKKETSRKIALGVMLCIFSPMAIILLPVLSEMGVWSLSENVAAAIGVAVLFILIVIAVADFIVCGMKTSAYEFLEKEILDTEYGVEGMVKEKKKNYQPIFTRNLVVGVSLILLGVIPLITVSCVCENEVVIVALLDLLLLFVGVAVFLFCDSGIIWESYKKILQEDEYTPEMKASNKRKEPYAAIYWTLATAIYLSWSFITNDWGRTWIVWPIAGVLFAVYSAVLGIVLKKEA